MLTQEISTYLETNGMGTTAAPSPTILTGQLLDLPHEMLAVYEYGGQASLWTKLERVYEIPRFQVVARAAPYAYVVGRAKLEEVYRLLDGFRGELSGTHYASIRGLQSPFFLSWDDKNRPQFVCNFEVKKELSPLS